MIILASASPRRKMLLEGAGYSLKTEPADIDERRHSGEIPKDFVLRISREKGAAAARHHQGEDAVIISADTIVVHAGEILGKPGTEDRAREMLKSLSGDVHSVYTGVCVIEASTGKVHQFVSETRVHFTALSDRRIDAYISTGEPMDKAGSYGIQGRAAAFVSHIEGSYTNVVGLPLCETVQVLESIGFFA